MTLRNITFGLLLGCGLLACGDSGGPLFGHGGAGGGASTSSTSTSVTSTSITSSVTGSGGSGGTGGGGGGLCTGVVCTASDDCHVAGTCDPAKGTCSTPSAPDGTPCAGPNVCSAASCMAGACTAGAPIVGTVDQSELTGNGGPFLESQPQQSVGETFIAGAAGHLTGIEVSLTNCASPPNGTIRLDLRDSAHQVLASASLSPSAFPSGCAAGNLDATTKGTAYFDLSAACLNVAAGDNLEIELFAVGFPVATCDLTQKCTDGPNAGGSCSIVNACSQYRVNVGENTDGNSYASGKEIVNGAIASGNHDIAFKTFIE